MKNLPELKKYLKSILDDEKFDINPKVKEKLSSVIKLIDAESKHEEDLRDASRSGRDKIFNKENKGKDSDEVEDKFRSDLLDKRKECYELRVNEFTEQKHKNQADILDIIISEIEAMPQIKSGYVPPLEGLKKSLSR